MEFGGPQTYTRIDIYDGAANMLCQRRSEALEDIVWKVSIFRSLDMIIPYAVPQRPGLTMFERILQKPGIFASC